MSLGGQRLTASRDLQHPTTFEALRVRNFRLYMIGQFLSVTGTTAQQAGQAWLVLHDLNGHGRELGLLSLFSFSPFLLFGAFIGSVTDRVDPRKAVMVNTIVAGLVTSVQAVYVLFGDPKLGPILVTSFLLGTTSVADGPTRNSLITSIVEPRLAVNAISLGGAVNNFGRIGGPLTAALLIKVFGTGTCFLLNSVSFWTVLALTIAMRQRDMHPLPRATRRPGQIREGYRYMARVRRIRYALLTVFATGVFALNIQFTTPLIVREVFGGSETLLGVLQALLGLGAIFGAMANARRRTPTPVTLLIGALGMAAVYLAMAASPSSLVAAPLFVLLGFSYMLFTTTGTTMVATFSEPEFRGRVVAMYVVLFGGSSTLGAPLLGSVSDHASPRLAVASAAISGIAGGAVVWTGRRAGAFVEQPAARH